MSNATPWVDAATARAFLNVSRQRLGQLAKEGRIEVKRINARRKLYSRSSLEQFKRDRTAPTQRKRRPRQRRRKRKPNRAAAMLAAMRRPLAETAELPPARPPKLGENRWIDRLEYRGWVQCARDSPGAIKLGEGTWITLATNPSGQSKATG